MPEIDQADPGLTLGVKEIATMTGRTVRWVQILAKEQGITKEGRGKYRLDSVLAGIVRHFEGVVEKANNSAASSSLKNAREREVELRIAEKLRDLIPQEDVLAVIDMVCGEVNKQFAGLPARITRDMRLRREIEAKLNEAKQKIAEAVSNARILAETGRDPTDPDASD